MASPTVAAGTGGGRRAYGGSQGSTTHTFAEEEELTYASYINDVLVGDEDCGHLLPVDLEKIETMYAAISEGVVLCKLFNAVVNDDALHIDRRVINKKKKLHPIQQVENHNLMINSCINIGLRIVNIGAMDIMEGRKHLVMGIMWQIIKYGLLDDVSLEQCPELYRLLKEGETLEGLMKLPAEQILLRWFNFHIEAGGCARRVSNFSSDLVDSECYTVLLTQVCKNHEGDKCTMAPMDEAARLPRAEAMLAEAAKIDCRKLITASQVVAGNPRLNLAFVANIFNTMPGLEPLKEEEVAEVEKEVAELLEVDEEDEGDSRNERAFRSWFNSLNIEREVTDLFTDIKDGVILLQSQDKLMPGVVDWPKMYLGENLELLHATSNCNFAVEYASKVGCTLVNIGGSDIVEGNRKLILGMSWQLMRMNILQSMGRLQLGGKPVDEAAMLAWANEKVGEKAPHIVNLQDKALSDGIYLLHMLDAVRPDAIEWSEVKQDGAEESKHENASYLISIARKIGCKIFLTWEDIVEVQPKMLMTLLAAALMVELAPSEEELAKMQADEDLQERTRASEEARQSAQLKHDQDKAEAAKLTAASEAAAAQQAAASTVAETKAADKAAAKAKMGGLAKTNQVKRRAPTGELDLSGAELEEAWQSVSNDTSETDWVWFTLTPDNKSLKVMESGDDGLEGMLDELEDHRVMFGYLRCIMSDGRPKFVHIAWVGPGANEAQKSWAARAGAQIDAFMRPFGLKITASDEDDIDEEDIMEKLTKSGGASY